MNDMIKLTVSHNFGSLSIISIIKYITIYLDLYDQINPY